MRALGPRGTNQLAGCTVVTCFDPQRAHVALHWARAERAMQREGHPLQVLHQSDRAAYAEWEARIERQLGFEILASPAAGLLDASGVCHWLDYGPSRGVAAHATELDIRVWEELLGQPGS